MIITVVGEHEITLPAERGTVHLSVGVESESREDAVATVQRVAGALVAEADRLRAAEPAPVLEAHVDAMRTSAWLPQGPTGEPLPARHQVSVAARVTFADADALARFVADWGEHEHVALQTVTWALSEATRAAREDDVLAEAVRRAHRRAEVMAAAAGAGPVTCVAVADPGLLAEPATPGGGFAAKARLLAADSGAVAVSPEEIRVAASIHARYEA